MTTTHILGMAKSCQDFKGAKQQKIELDFLRLVYAVKTLCINPNTKAVACFCVGNKEVKKVVNTWFKKYACEDLKGLIQIIYPKNLSSQQKAEINIEKAQNAIANTRHTNSNISIEMASGKIGKKIFEDYLEKFLLEEHQLKKTVVNKIPPFDIRWDFYQIKQQ